MSEVSLFFREEETVRHGRRLLTLKRSQQLYWETHYAELLAEYERLLGQAQRLVRLADLVQRDLNISNESLKKEMELRKQIEIEREGLIQELQAALDKVKTLSGLLPICAACKKVRSDEGYWQEIAAYIREHSEADFTHTICPDCARKLYPDLTHVFEKE
ncbi:MAG: hypothetical protein LDL33_09480 [Desulfomonile sp.]|nr:hypothetical protein [Desulfomonile sp.]